MSAGFIAGVVVGAVVLFIIDRKSTRLNSSHLVISYAVFCLKKKNRIPLLRAPIEFLVAYPAYYATPGRIPTARLRNYRVDTAKHLVNVDPQPITTPDKISDA